MDKINIDKFFNKHSNLYQFEEGYPEYLIDKEDFKIAVKEIVEAVVDKCAEEAEVRVTENALIEEGSCYTTYDDGVISVMADTKSILKVKEMIDYGKD